ncbi:MAG: AI-2E family transporter, partial [Anaerolineae bacterium]
ALAVPRVGSEVAKLADDGNRFFQSLTPERIDEYTRDLRAWIEETGLPVRLVTPRLPDEASAHQARFELNLEDAVRRTVADVSEAFRSHFLDFLKLGPRFAAKLVRSVLLSFLILMVAAFLLSDPQRVLGWVRSLFPQRLHDAFEEVLAEIDEGLAGVVRGQVLIALLNGVLTFIGMMILGVKFPVMLSTLTAVLSLIPIFGSFLSAIPIVAVGLTDGLGTGFGAMLWLIGINLAEANYFNPKIIGDQAKIHPALVVFALLAGERLYGVVGALFAVPLLSVGLAFFKLLHRRAIRWNQEHYRDGQDPPDPSAASPGPAPPAGEEGGTGP